MKKPEKIWQKKFFWPIIIFSVAAILRLLYFLEIKNNPLFLEPSLDAQIYHRWAWRIVATKNLIGTEPFLLNPGYPYLLALIYYIFGCYIKVVAVIQFIVGAVSSVLIYFISLKIFNKVVSILAGLIASAYGVFIFYEGFLVNFVWINFFNLLALLLLIKAIEKNSLTQGLLSGIFVGLSAVFRPNILMFIILILLWSILFKRQLLRIIISGIIGVILMLSPCILRNYIVLKEPIISSVSMGINFYIGNHPDADGSFGALKKIGLVAGIPQVMLNFFKEKTKLNFKRDVSYTEMNLYLFKEGSKFITTNPIKWLKLFIKKTLLFINSREIGSNYNYEMFKKLYSKKLSYLLNFYIIGPISFIGLFFSIKNLKNGWLLLCFFFAYFFTVVIFFMLSEYRLPVVPILIIFCSYGLIIFSKKLKNKEYFHILGIFFIYILILNIMNINVFQKEEKNIYQLCDLGDYFKTSGDIEKAKYYYKEAININPSHYLPYHKMGEFLFILEDYQNAKTYFEKCVNITPTANEYTNLGSVYFNLNEYDLSEKNYLIAIKLDQNLPEAWCGLGSVYNIKRNFKKACYAWERYILLEPNKKEREDAKRILNEIRKLIN